MSRVENIEICKALKALQMQKIDHHHGNGLTQALFLTPASKKTKTQARNSSQKLKEKTQPQGGTFLLLRKTQNQNSFFTDLSH